MMKRKQLKYLLIIFLLVMVVPSCKKKEFVVATYDNAVVLFYVGDVKISSNDVTRLPKIKDKLNANDIIKTGKKSEISLQIQDVGVIRIFENSEVVLKSLLDSENGSVLRINSGTVFSKILKNKDVRYRNVTPSAVAASRGTEFTTSFQKNKSMVSVFSGVVNVEAVTGKENADVSQGKHAELVNNKIIQTNVSKLEELRFKKMTIPEYFDDIASMSSDDIQKKIDSYKPAEQSVEDEIQKEIERWNRLTPIQKLRELGKPLTELKLKDGSSIVGSVISQNENILTLDVGDGVVNIPKLDIIGRKIIK
jgi:hypothetical protein